jgi:L-cysteine S-thiosulfotransferase
MLNAKLLLTLLASIIVASCATPVATGPKKPSDAEITAALKASFKETASAKLDRLNQNDLQRACSIASETGKDLDPKTRETLQAAALASVKYPADGKFTGDWKRGEAIAQSGRGMQFSDAVNTPAGGNCYACHQINKAEISHGNIGPTLWNYGKLRGNSEPILKYTWARIWNSHAFNACANMPRFGDAGILTEAQIKDVMALLLDPESPVNK